MAEADPATMTAQGGGKRRQWPIAVIAGVSFVAVIAGLWYGALKDHFEVKRWGVVAPGLVFRSGQISSSLIRTALADNHIKVIVALTVDVGHEPQRAEEQAAREMGIEFHRFPLAGDGTGDIRHYADAIEEIDRARKARQPVLVHCDAGTQRTGGVVAMYRVLVEQMPASMAYEEMTYYGLSPKRDAVLLKYLNEHEAELAALLKARGVIREVPEPLPAIGP